MEHYEIADMFAARQRPKLLPRVSYVQNSGGQSFHEYKLRMALTNEGRALCQFYGVELEFPKCCLEEGFPEDRRQAVRHINAASRFRTLPHPGNPLLCKLVFKSRQDDPPLFPGETVELTDGLVYGGTSIVYGMSNQCYDQVSHLSLHIVVYADSAPPLERMIPFNDLNRF